MGVNSYTKRYLCKNDVFVFLMMVFILAKSVDLDEMLTKVSIYQYPECKRVLCSVVRLLDFS